MRGGSCALLDEELLSSLCRCEPGAENVAACDRCVSGGCRGLVRMGGSGGFSLVGCSLQGVTCVGEDDGGSPSGLDHRNSVFVLFCDP